MSGNKKSAASLDKSKGGADASFAKDQCAGAPAKSCPAQANRNLTVEWSTEEVYCADPASLLGKATGIAKSVTGSGAVKVQEKGVASLKGPGQASFKLDWKATGVDFKAGPAGKMPDRLAGVGELSADGLSAKTPKALALKRLPDKDPEAVSFNCSSPKTVNGTNDYAWSAAFKLGVKNAAVQVKQTLQIKKAWLGKWVSFDKAKDKIDQGWGFVKKSGAKWNYWNTTDKAWKALPRNVSSYTLTSLVFVKDGASFKGRDDASQVWPESFAEPKNYEAMKKKWHKNIQDTWGRKFKIKHKDCTGTGLCSWDVDIDVDWSAGAGDKLVYAIWAADWERSNASDWYLSETRLGVAGHECGHLLGAYDEYTGGAIHPTSKKIEDNTIMGQNLTGAKARHLDGFRDEVQKKIKGWIGRDWKLEVKNR